MEKSSFDDFVEGLPNNDEGFDINSELNPSLADSQSENNGNVEDKPSLDGDNSQDEEELPYNKNPKIKKFIERQAKKEFSKYLESMGNSIQRPVEQPYQASQDSAVPAEWIAMYGDSEDTRKAWEYNKKILDSYKSEIKRDLLTEIQSSEQQSKQKQKEFEDFVENNLEELEEQHGVDLTSNSSSAKKSRSEFLDLVQRLSPKDAEGNVVSFADFGTAFELYKSTKTVTAPSNARNKALASRSMAKSSDTVVPPPQGYIPGSGAEGVRRAIGLE